MSPRPSVRDAAVRTRMGGFLDGPFGLGRGGPGGWIILAEPELRLPLDADFDTLVPDLAGWRRERLASVPDEASMRLAPDWVCEILSPSTALRDRAQKLPFYARAGVDWAWLISVDLHMIEVFERSGSRGLARLGRERGGRRGHPAVRGGAARPRAPVGDLTAP